MYIIKDQVTMDQQNQPINEVTPPLLQSIISTIFQCEDQSLNIMTDPKSPYALAPEMFKQIFEFDPVQKKVKIKKTQWKFDQKLSKTNICTFMFPSGGQYYTCKDCCNQTRPGVTMCYCTSCWVPEKHLGHNFAMRKTFGEGAYCDCGRQSAMKPESFCCSHENTLDQISLQINLQQHKQFLVVFESMLLAYFYVKTNPQNKNSQKDLQQLIIKFIRERCEGSLLYIRLCSYVLKKSLKIKEQQKSMLEWLLNFCTTCEKALFVLTADNLFKSQIYKAFQKCKKDGWKSQNNFRLIQAQFFMNDYLIFKLAGENIYVSKQKNLNKKYLQIASRSAQGIKILQSYLNFEKQKHQLQGQQFIKFLQQFIDDKTNKFITPNKEVAKILLKYLLKEAKKQSINNLNAQQAANIITYVAVLSLCIGQANLSKLQEIVCAQIGQNSQELVSQFLKFFIKRMKTYIMNNTEQKQYLSVVMLALMKGLPNQDELTNLVWDKICENDEDKRENLIEVINLLYHFTTLIVNSAPILSAYNQVKDQKQKQKDEQELEIWMKTYLCESEKMTKNQILSMREKGLFNFPNSGKLLKSMCKYDESTDMFEYNSPERYSNYVMRFKVRKQISSTKLKNVPKERFRLSDSFQFQCAQSVRQILDMIFGSKGFAAKFCTSWNNMMQKLKDEENEIGFRRNYDLGFTYAVILVYGNVFARGKNQQLLKQISKIRYSPQLRKKLGSLSLDANSIDILLQVDRLPKEEQALLKSQTSLNEQQANQTSQIKDVKNEEKLQGSKEEIIPQQKQGSSQKQIQQASQSQRKKKLFQARKLKLKQKYKANAQNFLPQQAKKQKQNSSQSDQSQQVCIICHEGSAKNHSIMYIAHLEKNSSISNFVHGLEDKSQVNISSCLHHMHSSCYGNINKNGFDFNCPLCSKRSNILLPTDCRDKKSVNRCKNIINALEVSKFKNYDFNSLLLMLVKNLMGDYGLNALSFKPFYELEKKRRRKTDKIILELAQNYCQNLTQFDRAQFQEQFKTLLQNIDSCKKKQVILVQKFFATLIYDKIYNKQINLLKNILLSEMYSNIVKEEYETIKQNIVQITHEQIQFPTAEQKGQSEKLSLSIQFLQLPQTTEQFTAFGQKKCNVCQKATQRICGICKKSFCSKCSQEPTHRNQHNSGLIMIDLDKKKLIIKQQGGKVNGNHNIYFDSFMSPLEDIAKYPNKQTYYLQQIKLQKLFTSFLLRN